MRLGYRTCFHTLYDEKKCLGISEDKKKKKTSKKTPKNADYFFLLMIS